VLPAEHQPEARGRRRRAGRPLVWRRRRVFGRVEPRRPLAGPPVEGDRRRGAEQPADPVGRLELAEQGVERGPGRPERR
jgi:hypothetical protein